MTDKQNTDNRPNIVFILTDDQGPWAMGCAGNSEIETPNLDRLAATGMRFRNFFCASPVCSPARASLVTGRIPSQHGVHDWLCAGNTVQKHEPAGTGELVEYLEGQPGYTDFLAGAGYTCALSGKWHLGDSHHPQKNFEFWKVHAKGAGPYYNAPMVRDGEVYQDPGYVTDVITDNALEFLESRKGNPRPFYLSVHYTAPHSPWDRNHHPAETYDRYHSECPFKSTPDGLTPPAWVQMLTREVRDAEDRRATLSGYFTAVTEMDRNVGRLLDWLENNRLRDSTLVVFVADNGMSMGHHGVWGKGNATFPLNMFEEAVKVPFIISHPGRIKAGSTCDMLASQYDFMPTLLDYTGVENPVANGLPGVSFAPVLRGRPGSEHDHVVAFDEYGPVRMIHTGDWKYVHRYAYGPNELYDLTNDPGEERNLVGDTGYAAREKEMRDRLTEWFARYVDPARDGIREAVTGSGQFGFCGAASEGRNNFAYGRVEHILMEHVRGK